MGNVERGLYVIVGIVTFFGSIHHIDHLIRGNHVGWPLIGEVTAFTFSISFYPLVLTGLWLTWRGRAGPRYWAGLSFVGSIMVGITHFGPLAVEPPTHIIRPYHSHTVGVAAVSWLIAFEVLLAVTALYSFTLWLGNRREAADAV